MAWEEPTAKGISDFNESFAADPRETKYSDPKAWKEWDDYTERNWEEKHKDNSWRGANSPEEYNQWLNDKDIQHGDWLGSWDYQNPEKRGVNGEELPPGAVGWTPNGDAYYGDGLKGWWKGTVNRLLYPYAEKPTEIIARSKERMGLTDIKGRDGEYVNIASTIDNWWDNMTSQDDTWIGFGSRGMATVANTVIQGLGEVAKKTKQVLGTVDFMTRWAFDRDKELEFNGLKQMWEQKSFTRAGAVSVQTPTDFGEALDVAWNSSRVLYSGVWDATIRADYIRRYMNGENPYMLTMEMENPIAEMAGEFILDPLNWVGAITKGIARNRDLTRVAKLMTHIDEPLELALRGADNLDDVGAANKIQEIVDIIMRNGEATKDGLVEYARSYGLRSLTASGKAQEKGIIVGNVLASIVANQTPERSLEMLSTLVKLYSGDRKAVELGVVALRHMDDPRILLSEAGRLTGVMFREALTDGKGAINVKSFIKGLQKASAGGIDEVSEYVFKVMAKSDSMFPSVDEMEKAYKLVNAGKGKDIKTIRLAEQYKALPGYVKKINTFDKMAGKVRHPVNNFLSGIYMGYNPGFAMRNLIQNVVIGTIDEGFGLPTLFGHDKHIDELTKFFGNDEIVKGLAKGFGAGSTGMGSAEKVTGFASKASDYFEQRSSAWVATKAMKRTWSKMLKAGMIAPDTTILATAGMPPEQIGMLMSLVQKSHGDVDGAIKGFRDILVRGRGEYWRSGNWFDDKTFGILQDLGREVEVMKAVRESDDVPSLVKRLGEIRDEVLKYGMKGAKKSVGGVSIDNPEAIQRLEDLTEFVNDILPEDLAKSAIRLFTNHINANEVELTAHAQVWEMFGKQLAETSVPLKNLWKKAVASNEAYNLQIAEQIEPLRGIGRAISNARKGGKNHLVRALMEQAFQHLPENIVTSVKQSMQSATSDLDFARIFYQEMYYPHYNEIVKGRNAVWAKLTDATIALVSKKGTEKGKVAPVMWEALQARYRAKQFNNLATNFKKWDGLILLDLQEGKINNASMKLLNMFNFPVVDAQPGKSVIFTEPRGLVTIIRSITGDDSIKSIRDIKTIEQFDALHSALYNRVLAQAERTALSRVKKSWKPLTGEFANSTASSIKAQMEKVWGKIGEYVEEAITKVDEPEPVTKLWDNVGKNLGSDQDGLRAVEDARNALRQWLEQRGATKADLKKFDGVMKPLIEETDTAIGTAVHVTGDTGVVNMSKQGLDDLLSKYVVKSKAEVDKIINEGMSIGFEDVDDEIIDAMRSMDEKEDLGHIMQGIDPQGLVGGVVDGGAPSVAQGIDAQKVHIAGFFDNLIKQAETAGAKTYPEIVLNGEIDKALATWSKQAINRAVEAKAIVAQVTKEARDFTMLNYDMKTYGQLALAYVMPYSFWYTASYKNWLRRIVTDPAVIAGYSKYKDAVSKIHAGAPDWVRYGLNTNELLGIDSEHPLFFNLEATLNPLNGLVGVDFNDKRRRVTRYSQYVDDLGKSGASVWTPISWITALALKMDDEEDAAARFAGRLFPQSAFLKSLLSVANARIEIGGGVNELDPSVHLWSGGTDPYERGRVARKLYWMVEQDMITEAEAIDAASGQNPELWNDAVIAASKSRFGSNMASSLLGVGFKGRSTEDVEIDRMNTIHTQLINMRHNLSPEEYAGKMQAIRDAFPGFDAIQIARKAGYERDSALGWNVLQRLPPGQKDDLMMMVGLRREMQTEWYENKGDIKAMIKAGIWNERDYAKFMDGMLSLSVIFDLPDSATRQEWEQVTKMYKAINAGIEQQFGKEIYDVQTAYYAIPDTDPEARDAYLGAHPELREMWRMKDTLIFAREELRPYYHNMEKIERYYDGLKYRDLDAKAPTWRDDMAEYKRIQREEGSKQARAFWNKTDSLQTYSKVSSYWEDYIAKSLVNISGYLKSPAITPLRDIAQPDAQQEEIQQFMQDWQQPDVNPVYRWDANQWADKMGATLTRRVHDIVVRDMRMTSTVRQQIERLADDLGEEDYVVWELLDQAFNDTGRGADIRQ